MRYVTYGSLFIVLALLTGCNSRRNEVVTETYVHKYGVEVPQEDWASSGQNGQVVTALKNGVIVTKNYSAGELEGATHYTFPHSKTVQKTEFYSKGVLEKEVENYRTGKPYSEKVYVSPTVQDMTYWYENGTLQAKERIDNNLIVNGEYYNDKAQIEASVKNGEGSRLERDVYGAIVVHDKIKNGQMYQRTLFHPNGAPRDITSYSTDGVVAGERRTYLPDGEPNTIEQWAMGVQEGLTIVFENGEKFAEIPYATGKKTGVERRYRDGEISEEITWLDDLRHGPTYIHVGDVIKTEWYHADKHVNKNVYDRLNPKHSLAIN